MTEQNEYTTEEVEITEMKKSKETLLMVLLPVIFLFGLAIGYLLWGSGVGTDNATAMLEMDALVARQEALVNELAQIVGGNAAVASGDNPAAPDDETHASAAEDVTVPDDLPRYDIEVTGNDPAFGPENAPIVIIEYSDFQCPYCQRHNAEVKPLLMEKYGDQILYIYKNFPLTSIHPAAVPAAEAALCAQDQEAYEAYHDLLFSGTLELNEVSYQAYAEQLGLDMDTFNTCVEERVHADQVQADFDFASDLGIRSTPTFFINGIAVVGAQPFDVFESVIQSELAQQ